MTCAFETVTEQWLSGFRARTAAERTPVSAHFELTRRCNLHCRHCYLTAAERHGERCAEELTTAAVKAALNEWAAAGVLFLTLSGGEPLLRKDFADIYRYARELGLVVTVFTNGTRLTDAIADLFRELPPRKVEISLYGATAATHDAITGIPGSHAAAWAGIRRLLANGTRVFLKTVLMTANQHERADLEQQAAEAGCEFRHDAAIFPRIADASPEPLALRVTPETAVAADLATPERRRMWRKRIEQCAAGAPSGERLYACSAGITAFHADPFGGLSPCLLTRDFLCPADDRPFDEKWRAELGKIAQVPRRGETTSFTGKLRGACTHCPAANRLETGDAETEPEYMRTTTRLRFDMAMSRTKEE